MAGPGPVYGIDKPVLGYRNWTAHDASRDGPDTRFHPRMRETAPAQVSLLQRWQPDLLLDTASAVELVREHHAQRAGQRLEGMKLQGNSLWVPPIAPEVSGDDGEEEEEDDQEAAGFVRRRRLVVHAAGPILDRLLLSWINQGPPHRTGQPPPEEPGFLACWMSGSAGASAEVGTVRQIAPLGGGDAPMCFVRGTTAATLLQLRPQQPGGDHAGGAGSRSAGRGATEDEEGETRVPFYLSPLQKLQFQHRLVDAATRGAASAHRAAFLTEELEVYDWSSAAGAVRVSVDLPPSPHSNGSRSGGSDGGWEWPQPRLAFGAHPRSLWLSAHSCLHHLDMRQRTAAARLTPTAMPIRSGRWPHDLLGPDAGRGTAARSASQWPSAATAVGAMERHPLDAHLLFLSADHHLLVLDLRQPREPVAVLAQAGPSHLLSVGTFESAGPSPSRTWVASGCRFLPRLHLHLEQRTRDSAPPAHLPPSGLGMLDEWCSGGAWLTRGAEAVARRSLRYDTGTFANWDHAPGRGDPVWLAGVGVIPPACKTTSRAGGSAGKDLIVLPYATSLGDVYLQRVLYRDPADNDGQRGRPRPLWEAEAIPCGLSPHVRDDASELQEGGPPSSGDLPSSAFYHPYDDASLRDRAIVAVEPPGRAFGPIVAGCDEESRRRSGIKAEESRPAEDDARPQARRAALAEVVAEFRDPLLRFLGSHPRTVWEVAAEVERLAPGSFWVEAGEPGVKLEAGAMALQDLHMVLQQEAEEFGLIVHVEVEAIAAGASRPDEASVMAGDGEECQDEASRADGPLLPWRKVLWTAASEALAPAQAEGRGDAEGERGRSRGDPHGVENETINFLRGKWHEEEVAGEDRA